MIVSTDALAGLRIDRSLPRRRRWVVALALVLGLAALGGTTVLWKRVAHEPYPVVQAATVVVQAPDAPVVLTASGYITARRRSTVASRMTGEIVEVNAEEGTWVRAGQVLARLDDSNARAALLLAEAEVDRSRKAVSEEEVRLADAGVTLHRQRRLADNRIVTQADVDTAQSQVDLYDARMAVARQQVVIAERRVELLRTQLNEATIRAPFDGVVIARDAQVGEMISPISGGGGFTRTGIFTIVDMRSLEIQVDINEAYMHRVTARQRVSAALTAFPDDPLAAHVISIVPAADRLKATVRVRIGLDATDTRVLPDMGVKVSFLAEPQPTRIASVLIPRSAVLSESSQPVAFVVRDDVVDRRELRLGARVGEQIEVTSGVAPGERVIVRPSETLEHGTRVSVQ